MPWKSKGLQNSNKEMETNIMVLYFYEKCLLKEFSILFSSEMDLNLSLSLTLISIWFSLVKSYF